MDLSENAEMLYQNAPNLKAAAATELNEKQITKRDTTKKPPLTLKNFQNYLNKNGYDFSFDTVTREPIFKGFGNENTTFLPETAPIILTDKLKKEFTGVTRDTVGGFITVIGSRNEENPIIKMISSVRWDGKDRIKEFYDLFQIKENDLLSREAIRLWLIQAYCMLCNEPETPFASEFILVFKGTQGLGKTRFLEHLCFSQKYFASVICDPHNRDSVMSCTNVWIAEFGELESTTKKDIGVLKNFLTQAKDRFRAPYGKAMLSYPRRTTFCGTVNTNDFLKDQTGNRRFVVVPLPDDFQLDYETQIAPFDSLQLWAQVKSIVDKEVSTGKTMSSLFRLSPELRTLQEKRNANYVAALSAEDEVLDIIEEAKRNGAAFKLMTVSDFKNDFSTLSKYSVKQISMVLDKLGIEQHRTKTARLRMLPDTRPKYNTVES